MAHKPSLSLPTAIIQAHGPLPGRLSLPFSPGMTSEHRRCGMSQTHSIHMNQTHKAQWKARIQIIKLLWWIHIFMGTIDYDRTCKTEPGSPYSKLLHLCASRCSLFPKDGHGKHCKLFLLGSLFLHSIQTNTLLLAFVVNLFIRSNWVYLHWPLLNRILEMRWDLRNTLVLSEAHSS